VALCELKIKSEKLLLQQAQQKQKAVKSDGVCNQFPKIRHTDIV
jgi:hypothetical protein